MAELSLAAAFLAGLAGFASPCVLPLVPTYLAYLSAVSSSCDNDAGKQILHNTLAFVLGLAVALSALGFALGAILQFLSGDMLILASRVSGAVIVVFGLYILGFVRLGFFEKRHGLKLPQTASLLGVIFHRRAFWRSVDAGHGGVPRVRDCPCGVVARGCAAPLIWRGPMLNSAIRQFLGDVEWGELDYLIVDLPPGTGDAALSLAQALPLSGAVVVTLPQLVSLEDASRGLNMFKQLEVPILGVVENMSCLDLPDGTRMDIFGSGGGAVLAKATETTFLGQIPIDQNIRIGGDNGNPIVDSDPDSVVAKAITEISQKIAAKVSVAALGANNNLPINIVE